MIDFVKVISFNITELNDAYLIKSNQFSDNLTYQYGLSRMSYLSGRPFDPNTLTLNFPDTPEAKYLKKIMCLRAQISKSETDTNFKNYIEVHLIENILAEAPLYPLYAGEAYGVSAQAFYILKMYKEAAAAFENAATKYLELDLQKLALKCLGNKISALQCLDLSTSMISELLYMLSLAKKVNDISVLGTTYLSISREHFINQTYDQALKYIDLAIENLQCDSGTTQYYTALEQKGRIYMASGQYDLANTYFKDLLICPFSEIISTVKYLMNAIESSRYTKEYLSELAIHLGDEKALANKTQFSPLAEHEQALLKTLSAGPLGRYEIIDTIYDKNVPIESLENRFKNLLNRFQKKYPGIIKNMNGKYFITSPLTVSRLLSL